MSAIGAGISAAASMENTDNTNMYNYMIAKETNKANYEIAQQANQYNMEMLNKQIRQEWDMWNAQNEYNSASAQRQRLEEAGLNPYLMMDGGSAGTASKMTSPSAQPAVVPQMQAPTMQTADLSALAGIGNVAQDVISIMDAKKSLEGKQLQNDILSIEKNYRADKLLSEMQKNLSGAAKESSEARLNRIRENWMDRQFAQDYDMKKLDMFLRDQQIVGQVIGNLQQSEILRTLPQKLQNELGEQVARIALLRSQKKLTDKQADHEVEKMLDTFYSRKNKELDYDFTLETWKINKNKLKAEMLKAINNTGPEAYFGMGNILHQGIDQAKGWITGSNDRDFYDWSFDK